MRIRKGKDMSKFDKFIDSLPPIVKGYCFVVSSVVTLVGIGYLASKVF